MNTELLNKTLALDTECDRFLTAFNADSLPRVVERGLKPIFTAVADVLATSGIPLGFVDIKQVQVGHNKIVEGIVHIGVDVQGKLIAIVVSPDGSKVAPPHQLPFETAVSLGVTGIELVQGVKQFAQTVLKAQMSHTQGSA